MKVELVETLPRDFPPARNLAAMAAAHDLETLEDNPISAAGSPRDVSPERGMHGDLKDALEAIDRALTLDREKSEAIVDSLPCMNARIRTTANHLRQLHKSVNIINTEGEAHAMDRLSWALIVVITIYCLTIFPNDDDKRQVAAFHWYWCSHLVLLLLTLGLSIAFWRKHIILDRVHYALTCSKPWLILFYSAVYYAVWLYVDEEGYNISNKLSSTTTLVFFLGFISLDACDCSWGMRLFVHVFIFFGMVSGLYISMFVWTNAGERKVKYFAWILRSFYSLRLCILTQL